jgi:outer membrane immunogenic protein
LKKALLAGAAIGAVMVALPVLAADLPASAPVYKATPAAPAFSWSGFYFGIEGGGAWGRSKQRSDVTDITGTFNLNGGLVGGTYGTNWQFGHLVLGMESDASWVSLRGTAPELIPPSTAGFTARTDQTYLGTNRGRIGYAEDRWLVYATGGLADTLIEAASTGPGGTISQTKYRWGWTAGGGVEWAFAPQWSAKLEYIFADFRGNTAYLNPVPAGFVNRAGGVTLDENIVRVGVNYHYDLPGLLLSSVLGKR